jgi:hypothetical protein
VSPAARCRSLLRRPANWAQGGVATVAPRLALLCPHLLGLLCQHLLGLLCPTLLGLALRPGPAGAQTFDQSPYPEEPAGLVYTIDSRPVRGHAQLSGRSRFQGSMPLSVPAELMGEYRIQVTAPGYETQRGHLRFPGSGAPLALRSAREADAGALARACVWPGFAAMTSGESDPVRGVGLATAGGVGVTGLVASEVRRRDAEGDTPTPPAPGDLGGETRARIEEARNAGVAEAARSARNTWAIFTAAAWGLSLLDTYALAPGIEGAAVDLTEVTLELKPFSRGEAALRSLIPGFGQTYARRRGAAIAAFYGALGSLTSCLIAENAYEESRTQIAALEDLYDDPGADPEALALVRAEIESESETAEDRERLRNILLGITAGVWALNVVDAWIGTPAPDSAGERAQGAFPLRVALVPGPAPGCRITVPF